MPTFHQQDENEDDDASINMAFSLKDIKNNSLDESMMESQNVVPSVPKENKTRRTPAPKTIRPSLSSALVVNIISFGYLVLPWAFAQTGLILSCLVLVLVFLQTYLAAIYIAEACARAETWAVFVELKQCKKNHRDDDDGEKQQTRPTGTNNQEENQDENDPFPKDPQEDTSSFPRENTETTPPTCDENTDTMMALLEEPSVIKLRKFELSDLTRIFLGPRWSLFFTTTIGCDLLGITWVLAALFGSSLADFVAPGRGGYYYTVFLVVFAVLAVPLTCMPSLVDQLRVQMVFLACRMIMLLVMAITVVVAFRSHQPHFDTQLGPQDNLLPLFGFGSFHLLIQISIFSTTYQFAVPGISETSENKAKAPSIFRRAAIFIFIPTLFLSILLSLYFGPDLIEVSSNLNWSAYHGGTGYVGDKDGSKQGIAWWARFISGYVVLYPAIDGIGLFSLCAVSLGEILMGAWYKQGVHEASLDWKRRVVFRLLGSIPQIVGAVFVSDLSVIANYAGIFTVISYSCCPCLLSIYSKRMLTENGLSSDTAYKTMFSHDFWAWLILVTASIAIVFVIVVSIIDG